VSSVASCLHVGYAHAMMNPMNTELRERCDFSAQETIAFIRCHLYKKKLLA